ncbi:hypothetical protein FRB91_002915 [Serendipita sp. 411]|nr:hypothetical protein FRC16_005531 [Serendipita sp. 398]KAG8807411.1 hypothetical protein FRC18_005574 [Serendipita sp. 400]KAG8840108.1 hypothetical protein FRC20_005782 [Serendipita sp. 405]KAG8844019.1 hypothetical protein FRB91_002915 [Serendipita sp. 411]
MKFFVTLSVLLVFSLASSVMTAPLPANPSGIKPHSIHVHHAGESQVEAQAGVKGKKGDLSGTMDLERRELSPQIHGRLGIPRPLRLPPILKPRPHILIPKPPPSTMS